MSRALIVVLVGIFAAYMYYETIKQTCDSCALWHREMMAHINDSPYRYRVLSPYLTQMVVFGDSDLAIVRAHGIAHLLGFPIMFLLLYRWLRVWLDIPAAMIGILTVGGLLTLMVRIWGTALYSVLEIVFLCIGLLLLHSRGRGWQAAFALLVAFAALNRETAILLPVAYFALDFPRLRERSYWLYGLLLVAIWAVIFGGLRLTLGTAPDALTIAETWAFNAGRGWAGLVALFPHVFFLPIWVLYLVNFRRAPVFLRRLSPVIPFYVALVLVFASWREVRLLLPLLVLTLPIALQGIDVERSIPTRRQA
jgi:hypothetical protein